MALEAPAPVNEEKTRAEVDSPTCSITPLLTQSALPLADPAPTKRSPVVNEPPAAVLNIETIASVDDVPDAFVTVLNPPAL